MSQQNLLWLFHDRVEINFSLMYHAHILHLNFLQIEKEESETAWYLCHEHNITKNWETRKWILSKFTLDPKGFWVEPSTIYIYFFFVGWLIRILIISVSCEFRNLWMTLVWAHSKWSNSTLSSPASCADNLTVHSYCIIWMGKKCERGIF